MHLTPYQTLVYQNGRGSRKPFLCFPADNAHFGYNYAYESRQFLRKEARFGERWYLLCSLFRMKCALAISLHL